MTDNAFSEAERQAVYKAIAERRDMRHFTGGAVEPELLRRLLEAAQRLGGQLTLEYTPGGGLTAIVRLPRCSLPHWSGVHPG